MDYDGGWNEEESGRRRSAAFLDRSSTGVTDRPGEEQRMSAASASDSTSTSAAAVGVHPAAPRLLDALRERLRYMHYSLRTEEANVYWVRGFVRWAGSRRHPREMGAAEVQAFLSMLANERHVAAATHRQALSALLFLYREVLGVDMPWLQQLGRPVPHKRIPVVLIGHADVSTTMIYTHVLKSAAAGTSSPLDALVMTMRGRIGGDDDPARDLHPRAREPAFPCYRATPSFTAAATSAS